MTMQDTGDLTGGENAATRRRPDRRRLGVVLAAVGVAASGSWLAWRVAHLPVNVVAFAVLLVELAGVAATVAITIGLARADAPRSVFLDDPRDSHRFAFAVADLVGRTRSSDVHRDVVLAVRSVPRRGPRRSAEAAMAAVYLEGPRRLLLVVALSLGLLLGAAPMPVPPWWAAALALLGSGAVAGSHVVLGAGRIRLGDRTRWSYSSIGEAVGAVDLEGFAPRRWVGTMATIVVVNLAIALRGTSDRWTHGLDPMPDEARIVTMSLAILVVAGALFTMRTIQAPVVDDTRWSRRLEERSARRSALGATVVVGVIGLFAGVLPGGVDAAQDDTVRVVQLVDDGSEPAGG